jgi:4-aminobutyrate aminotransferase-like enzyme
MVGIELDSGTSAEAVQTWCVEHGLLVLTCGPKNNVLRLIPALTITDDEVDQAVAILAAAFDVLRNPGAVTA